jgi:hypothetical protein
MPLLRRKDNNVAPPRQAARKGGKPAPTPKLHGKRQPLAVTMPPELITRLDALAAAEDRSRSKMVEIIVRAALDQRELAREVETRRGKAA